MATRFPPPWNEFLKSFEDEEVDYLLIGPMGVGYHGYARATVALVAWIAVNPTNAEKVLRALRRFGMYTLEITTDLLLAENKIIRIGDPYMSIEIQTGVSGVDFESCYRHRQRVDVGDFDINVISLEYESAANRLDDLDELEYYP